jgi:hypothetical protein
MNNTIVAGNYSAGSSYSASPNDIRVYELFNQGGITGSNDLVGDPNSSGGLVNGTNGNIVGQNGAPIPLGTLFALDSSGKPLVGTFGGTTGVPTLALVLGSPAIAAGSVALAVDDYDQPLTVDDRGEPREVGGSIDIGAFESQGYKIQATGGSGQTATVFQSFSTPLTVAVSANYAADPAPPGGSVTFTAPASGASAIFTSAVAVVGADGTASTLARPDDATGLNYTVTASFPGIAAPATFTLSNTAPASVVVNTTSDLLYSNAGLVSLRMALGYAGQNPGANTIAFAPSVLGSTARTLTLTAGPLDLTDAYTGPGNSVSIAGAGLLTISGGGTSGVFVDHGGNASLSGLTITGGDAAYGGGLFIDAGSVALTGCTVTGNIAQGSGGYYNPASGGGIDVAGSGSLTLTGCAVTGNSAQDGYGIGGGIAASTSGAVMLAGCTVSGNTAQGGNGTYIGANVSGGGIAATGSGPLKLTDCTVSGNTARGGSGGFVSGQGFGGGIDETGSGPLTLISCTVTGNTAQSGHSYDYIPQSYGGGVAAIGSGAVTLTGSTVSGNAADVGGGVNAGSGGTTSMNDTIVAGNFSVGSSYANSPNEISGSVTGTYDLIGAPNSAGGLSNGTNGNIVGQNGAPIPLGTLFALDSSGNLLVGTFGGTTGVPTLALVLGSPAIAAGSVALAVDASGQPLTVDARGKPREVGGTVDIGAFESQGYTFRETGGSGQTATVFQAFANPLAVAITANDPSDPVAGGTVTFTGPASGPSAIFMPAVAVIGADGTASTVARPNDAIGLDYSVTASIGRIATPLTFILSNTAPALPVVVNTASDLLYSNSGLVSLRMALDYDETLPGAQTITFDPSVFGSTPLTITLTNGPLDLTDPFTGADNSITIQGPGQGLLSINAGGSSRVFVEHGGTASLSGLTITGGMAADGGGLYIDAGSLALTDCTITGNSVQGLGAGYLPPPTFGGGIDVTGSGCLSLIGCAITGNTIRGGSGFGGGTSYGGGIADDSSGAVTLTDCIVSGNTAQGGGGSYSGASGVGGGIGKTGSGPLTLTDCTVSGNTARGSDGGINYHGQGFGGGVAVRGSGVVTLTGCTVTGNSGNSGGGVYARSGVTTSMNDTIVAGNYSVGSSYATSPTEISGPVTGAYDLIGDPNSAGGLSNNVNGNIVGTPSGGVIPLSSIFAVVTNGNPVPGNYGGPTQTFALAPGSPAIAAGSASVPDYMTTDQRGLSRNATPDIGAYETQTPTVTVAVANSGGTYTGNAFGATGASVVGVNSAAVSSFGSPDLSYRYYAGTLNAGQIATATPLGGAPINAGYYTVVAVFTSDVIGYRNAVSAPLNYRISQVPTFTTTVGAGPFTYSGATNAGGSGTLTGVANGAITLTYSGDQVDAGTYYVTAHYAGDVNHAASNGNPVAIIINKANATVTVTPYTATYDGTSHTASYMVVGAQYDKSATGGSIILNTTHTVAGTYTTDTWSFNGGTNYFSIAPMTITDTINQASPTITAAAGATVTIGSGIPLTASATLAGGVNIGGSIKFTLYSPSNAIVFTDTVAVNGNRTYSTSGGTTTGSPVPTVAGTYQWVAAYITDGNNKSISTAQGNTPEGVIGTGISIVGTTLYITGGNTSDYAAINPAGSKSDGTTGLQVAATLNNVWISQTFNQTFSAIVIVGLNGNDNFQLATTLTLPANITEGNGNNYIQTGGGNDFITFGTGSNQVFGGGGNKTIVDQDAAGTSAYFQLGNGNNTITMGAGNDQVVLGGGNNTVTAGNGNDAVTSTGTGNNTVTLGNGNDYLNTGNGSDVITLGSGNENILTGAGTKTITAGNGNNFVSAGGGNVAVTMGNGNDNIQLGGGTDTVTLGDGNDYVSAGNGNDTVTVGNGNDTIQLGNGSNVIVEGNGNDYVSAGNGANLVVGGLGQHTIQLGGGNNILIDGTATLANASDSFRQILSDWNSSASTSVNTRLKVVYNTAHPNYLSAGSGRNWFFYKSPTSSNKKATDRLN